MFYKEVEMFPPEDELKDFLRKAHANTYAGGDKNRLPVSSRPGSTEYRWEDEKFLYIDIYFGGREFIGEEVVYYEGAPVWVMNYNGSLAVHMEKGEVFPFLRKALIAGVKAGEFLRGPENWTEGGSLEYTRNFHPNNGQGSDNLFSFNGWENIYRKTAHYLGGVYRCNFQGGGIRE